MSYQRQAPRILVIDDDPEIRVILRQMLERAGYSVLDAPDGNVGITLYRQKRCDLIIVDIIMPVKEGLSTIRELKSESRKLKIIAISGGGRIGPEDYLQMAKKLGADWTLTKPFGREELLTAMGELLHDQRLSPTEKPMKCQTIAAAEGRRVVRPD
jgi:DNA-binding response OmpR family regulator